MDDGIETKPKRRSRGEDYVNNKELSVAVAEYVKDANSFKEAGKEPLQITDYIAKSILKISNGLSRSPNFTNYPYREDMVMDGVIDCIKGIHNYDISKITRGGAPNAFGYFTQICYYAFLRRIAKEKKQLDVKIKLIDSGSISNFMDIDDLDGDQKIGENIVEKLRQKNDAFYDFRNETSKTDEVKHKPAKRAVKAPRTGPLSDFIK